MMNSQKYPAYPKVSHLKLINQSSLGICLGASTISIVRIEAIQDYLAVTQVVNLNSQGSTYKVLNEALSEIDEEIPAVVTGRKFRNRVKLTSISESEATETALELYKTVNNSDIAAVASLGAETFVVYELNKEGKIRKLISKNQCASGTGEFYMQQIGRMNLDVDEAVRISSNSNPFKVSGRCSVFCKSDCTHALNKGIPKDEVTAGLSLMIAEKAEELLKRSHRGSFMVVGGVTQNSTVISFLKQKFENIIIPDEASYFEALGAAFYGLLHNVSTLLPTEDIFIESSSIFTFHKPLSQFIDKVTFYSDKELSTSTGNECILGLDVGSTTTKAVIIRNDDCKIIASEYLYTHGNPVKASKLVYESLVRQINGPIDIIGLGVTGSGRHITALHSGTKAIINEISAHAKASVFFDPEVDTIFEIGGQDAKYTYVKNRVPIDYAMNEACSAGTGSFIEEAAWESLKVSLYDVEAAAFRSSAPLNFRDQCAALIGSDIKSALQENYSHDDILAGIVYSICLNYINRVKGKRPIGKKIFMQGGVCYNKAIPVAMAAITGKPVIVPPMPGLMGAFGTALKVKEDLEKGMITKSHFDLNELIQREFITGKSFICKDKQNGCDRKCEINTFKINDKIIPFGGACNKYYDSFTFTENNWHKNDFISWRNEMIFNSDESFLPANSPTIGFNQTFTLNRLFPLYQSFFTALGFRVILPEKIDKAGFENQYSSFCYPVELAHGLYSELINRKPDFIFMPEIYEMHVEGCEMDPKDTSATCVFISKEINYLMQAFDYDENKIIHPYLNFAKGYSSQEKVFINVAYSLRIYDRRKIKKAFREAVAKQLRIEGELLKFGTTLLSECEQYPDSSIIVIVGRDYNAFSDFANKGIPQKFASLGYKVIPFDILDCSSETLVSYQSWEAGKRILRVAQLIKNHPQLFPVYISNFSCGPDSFIIPIFRNIMGNKPCLTLELDQHTADAGINTRIDAFLDVIINHRSSVQSPVTSKNNFKAAQIARIDNKTVYVDSENQILDLKDKNVQLVIPCIGDMVAALFAASLRSLGYNAVALPEMEPEILEWGQKYTSGKECLPIILLAGSLMNYVEKKRLNGERLAFFNIGGASACRIAQYPVFLANIIKNEEIKNVALFTLINQEGYIGLPGAFLKRSIEAITLNDVLEDVRSGILANAVDPEAGLKFFYEQFNILIDSFSNDYSNLFKNLDLFSRRIAKNVPYHTHISKSKYIALTGEIFIRHNQFAHKKLNHYFGRKGFIVKDAYISEWVKYLDYAWRKGVDRPELNYIEGMHRRIREQYITYIENKIQKILSLTGYLKPHKTRVINTIKHSLHVLPLESTGEPALTFGTAMSEGYEQYCGIINVGPFGCLQTRVAEAICSPNMTLGKKREVKENLNLDYDIPEKLNEDTEIPFLTIECDGKGYPQIIESKLETFLVQINRVANNLSVDH
ncbi:MAG: acyl-CoA dehydratase activase [Omnitrophica WOR_2 bacterium]